MNVKGFKVAANPVDSGAESQYLKKKTLIVLKSNVSILIHVSILVGSDSFTL